MQREESASTAPRDRVTNSGPSQCNFPSSNDPCMSDMDCGGAARRRTARGWSDAPRAGGRQVGGRMARGRAGGPRTGGRTGARRSLIFSIFLDFPIFLIFSIFLNFIKF